MASLLLIDRRIAAAGAFHFLNEARAMEARA